MARAYPRDVRKEQFWRRQVDGWRGSGQTVRAYCWQRRLSEPSFYAWRRELARRRDVEANGTGRTGRGRSRRRPRQMFVPVQVMDNQGAASPSSNGTLSENSPDRGVDIVLAGGRRLRVQPGFDGPTLAAVIQVLEGRPC